MTYSFVTFPLEKCSTENILEELVLKPEEMMNAVSSRNPEEAQACNQFTGELKTEILRRFARLEKQLADEKDWTAEFRRRLGVDGFPNK